MSGLANVVDHLDERHESVTAIMILDNEMCRLAG